MLFRNVFWIRKCTTADCKMLFTLVFGFFVLLFFIAWLFWDPLPHIPGPSLWELRKSFDFSKSHLLVSELQQRYGPVFKIPVMGEKPTVALANSDSIYQALVREGKLFGGRLTNFRLTTAMARTGILFNEAPDGTWKILRKTAQQHLRQFGDGLSRLEDIIVDIAEDMFSEISKKTGQPFDPKKAIWDTALMSIAFLVVSKRVVRGEPVAEKMREYEAIYGQIMPDLNTPISVKIIDVCPWLRHFGLNVWTKLNRLLQLESEIWQIAKEFSENNPEAESMYQVFRNHLQTKGDSLRENDAIKTITVLTLAGVSTTSTTFYAAINILAHREDTQDKLFEEIEKIQQENGRNPTLRDRPEMPYTRAVLFELLRYLSTVALSITHKTTENVRVGGYDIPRDTPVLLLLWNLHHNENVWDNPHQFYPERFLDKNGDVVPADHPYRKNLMPFGAGPRVCLGESLALTRLFLWLTTLIQRFRIRPAPGNDPSLTDPRTYTFDGILRPKQYKVLFTERR